MYAYFQPRISVEQEETDTNEALMIYCVGGTIDYVKSNETAKQLPDKCIKALDKWADNLTK